MSDGNGFNYKVKYFKLTREAEQKYNFYYKIRWLEMESSSNQRTRKTLVLEYDWMDRP